MVTHSLTSVSFLMKPASSTERRANSSIHLSYLILFFLLLPSVSFLVFFFVSFLFPLYVLFFLPCLFFDTFPINPPHHQINYNLSSIFFQYLESVVRKV
ncbi:hypothetical protein BDZ91DRAFT_737732, partial [Kalaharituber pfeilii]